MINSDDSGYSGKGIGVCVLDTGIYSHIDFTGRIRGVQTCALPISGTV